MKAIIGFGIGMVVAWFINWQLHKPVEAVTEVKAPVHQGYTKVNTDTFHNGINVWEDKSHRVVCWIYEAGVGNSSRAGISCLPFTQVSGVPAQ